MPIRPTDPPEPIPDDPLEWRPQLARRGPHQSAVTDPICEPDWEGVHVLVHFEARGGEGGGTSIRVTDTEGDDVTEQLMDLHEQLGQAIMAFDAVIDGFLTDQATRSGEGATVAATVKTHHLAVLTNSAGEIVAQPLEGHDRDHLLAFVAVDLLRVDGQDLFDIPLLERKRLLDGLLAVDDRIRVTPYTRPPVKPWLLSWQASGFRGAILKASNSRYRPTTVTEEWAVMSRLQSGR